jgi:hypothetical protein
MYNFAKFRADHIFLQIEIEKYKKKFGATAGQHARATGVRGIKSTSGKN